MCTLETLPVQSTAAAPVQVPCFVVVFTTLSCRTSFPFTTWQQRTLAEVNFRSAYHRAYLRGGTGIGEQYYIYCSPIPMLQIGIGSRDSEGGTKNALRSTAPMSRESRSDPSRLAGSVDETRRVCSLRLDISRVLI